MSAHTPGPFRVVDKPGDLTVQASSRIVAIVHGPPDGETLANADLFAAAPELADALAATLRHVRTPREERDRYWQEEGHRILARSVAALRKAGRLPEEVQ